MHRFLTFLFCCCTFTAVGQVKDTLIVFHKEVIYFENDSFSLLEDELSKIDSLGVLLEKSAKIVLEGHTDYRGSIAYNKTLSDNRVNSVRKELIRSGFSPEIIGTEAYGELRPQQQGKDETSNQLNRRVTIELYERQNRRKIKGQVKEETSGKLLFAKIKVTGKDFVDSTFADEDGSFHFFLPDNRIYKLEVIAECHFFDQRFIKVSSKESDEIRVELPSIDIGNIYALPNLNFKGNLPILLPRSQPTLDLLYELLDQCEICVEIQGHINLPNEPDCVVDSDHYRLSVNRAKMVYGDMVRRGIDSTRMLPRGYGNWEMLYPKATREVDMVKNRRVEIKVISCDNSELTAKSGKQ